MNNKLISLEEFSKKLDSRLTPQKASNHAPLDLLLLDNRLLSYSQPHPLPHQLSLLRTAHPKRTNFRRKIFDKNQIKVFWGQPLVYQDLISVDPLQSPCNCVGTWDICLRLQSYVRKISNPESQKLYLSKKDLLDKQEWLDLLRMDLLRSDEQIPQFLKHNIQSVLRVTLKDTRLEYLQGMNHIFGCLVCHLKQEWKAHLLACDILNIMKDFFSGHQLLDLAKHIRSISNKIQIRLPKLSYHLQVNDIQPSSFLVNYLLTFMSNKVPLKFMSEVFFQILSEGPLYLQKLVLIFLSSRQKELLQKSGCDLQIALINCKKSERENLKWGQLLSALKRLN